VLDVNFQDSPSNGSRVRAEKVRYFQSKVPLTTHRSQNKHTSLVANVN